MNSNDLDVLDENYRFNDMLARAHAQLLPKEERTHVTVWLKKLETISGDEITLKTRNDYATLLLLAMQNDRLTEPFDKPPPIADLQPIADIMPPNLFQEMLTSSERNFSWIDDLLSRANGAIDDNGDPSNYVQPQKFLERQPQPINGVTCYFSVFSNQSRPQ